MREFKYFQVRVFVNRERILYFLRILHKNYIDRYLVLKQLNTSSLSLLLSNVELSSFWFKKLPAEVSSRQEGSKLTDELFPVLWRAIFSPSKLALRLAVVSFIDKLGLD